MALKASEVALHKQNEVQQRGQTDARARDGWREQHLLSYSLTDRWRRGGHVAASIPRLLTWHACQGYQIVRGEDGSRTKRKGDKSKRRDCVKSSWEGKTCDTAQC